MPLDDLSDREIRLAQLCAKFSTMTRDFHDAGLTLDNLFIDNGDGTSRIDFEELDRLESEIEKQKAIRRAGQ